jgi:hypothetical protein
MNPCEVYECFSEILGISLRNLALLGVVLSVGIAAVLVVWGRGLK